MLPDGWKETNIAAVIDGSIKNGYSPNPVENVTGFYVLSLGALGEDNSNFAEYKNIADEPHIHDFILKYGDFLISRSNTPDKVGRAGLYLRKDSNIIYPDLMMRFRANEDLVDKIFFSYYLKFSKTRIYFQQHAAGSSKSMVKINKNTVLSTPILLPPLAEQKKIAEILSTWDEAISVVDRQLENCRQQKKALMQKLLTGKKRLPGFSGEWREVKLGDVAQVEKGTPLNGNNIALGPYPVIAGGKTVTTWHKEYTHENVITVSASGAYAGYVSMHTQKIWASDCSVIAPLKYELDLNFLFQNMLFRQEDIYKLQVGGAQPHVYPKDLIKFYIPLPSLREQQAISDILGLADKQMCNLEKQAVLLQEEKKSLMQQLLTGKKRVAV